VTELDKGGRPERDELDRRRSAELAIPPSSDARPLWFITVNVRPSLSTARSIRRAGRLATADTCIKWLNYSTRGGGSL